MEHGFAYDSAAWATTARTSRSGTACGILELPVHWSLDDWPRFGWSIDLGGNVGPVDELHASWLAEYERPARRAGTCASRCTRR